MCVCVCVWYHTLAAATDRSSVHWHIIIISSFSTPGIFPVIGISLSFSLSTFSTSRFLSFISPFARLSFSSTISFCLLSSVLLHPSQSHSKTANLPEIISLKHLLTLTCCVCLFVCLFQCPREVLPFGSQTSYYISATNKTGKLWLIISMIFPRKNIRHFLLFSFLNVRNCCFSLSCMILDNESLGFSPKSSCWALGNHNEHFFLLHFLTFL